MLLGLIALTFVGFGASQLAAPGSDYIVKIGDQKVSDQALNHAVQGEQVAGRDARDVVFQSLIQRAYLTEGAKLMGIAVSQEQIKQIIVDDPSFHDSTGKFSQAKLSEYLNQRRMSEDQFVADIREQFALQNLINLVQNGTIVSDAQAAQFVNLSQASRTLRSATFNPEAFAGQIKADDKALQAFYDANKKDYLIPQAAKIEYVALNLADLAAKQSVSEAEIKKAFDEQAAAAPADAKPVFETEKARIEADLKKKKAAAEFNAAKEKLAEEAFNSPDSLAAAAKALGVKVEAPDEWLSRVSGQAAGIPAALLDAVFSDEVLKKKHNSEPVNINEETVWVVRAKEVREEKTAAFEEVKENVRTAYLVAEASKLAQKKAEEALADLKTGRATQLAWSPVSTMDAQQVRQAMPPEAYAELVKARPQGDKLAYALLSGLPAPVIVEVQRISPPENVNAQIPAAKQVLMQNQSANTFDGLLQYLNKQIKQEQGAQKVHADTE